MKRLFSIVTVSLAGFAAFAQGKIGFQNDSLHLVYWEPGAGGLAGQAANSDNLPPWVSGLSAALYMGTSSSQLYLYSSAAAFGPLAAGPGKWTSLSVQAIANLTTGAPAIPGGTTVFVDVFVHSTEKPPPNVLDPFVVQTYTTFGFSGLFTFTLGSGITYPVMWGANNNGTWPAGTWPMDQYGAGSRGAIILPAPEPSSVILASLGVAMLFFRKPRIFGRKEKPRPITVNNGKEMVKFLAIFDHLHSLRQTQSNLVKPSQTKSNHPSPLFQ